MLKDLTVRVTLSVVLDRTHVGSLASMVKPDEAAGYVLGMLTGSNVNYTLNRVFGATVEAVGEVRVLEDA